jgi:hypothetical protein
MITPPYSIFFDESRQNECRQILRQVANVNFITVAECRQMLAKLTDEEVEYESKILNPSETECPFLHHYRVFFHESAFNTWVKAAAEEFAERAIPERGGASGEFKIVGR